MTPVGIIACRAQDSWLTRSTPGARSPAEKQVWRSEDHKFPPQRSVARASLDSSPCFLRKADEILLLIFYFRFIFPFRLIFAFQKGEKAYGIADIRRTAARTSQVRPVYSPENGLCARPGAPSLQRPASNNTKAEVTRASARSDSPPTLQPADGRDVPPVDSEDKFPRLGRRFIVMTAAREKIHVQHTYSFNIAPRSRWCSRVASGIRRAFSVCALPV